MGFYHERIVPHLVNWAMRNHQLDSYRRRVLSTAQGRILEIGMGSGLNLTFYPPEAREIIGLEPSRRLLRMAATATSRSPLNVMLVGASAEAIPLRDESVDTVVTTWTLCTIPDPARALSEMRRVLRPEGKLLFVEHGLAPEGRVRRWQNRLNPAWKRLAGGCHLNRPISELIERAGFVMAQIQTGYMEGPKTMTFFYEGSARPA